MFFSPFEQFELTLLQSFNLFGFNFSLTTLTIYLILVFVVLVTIFFLATKQTKIVPTAWQSLIEISYLFILSLIIEQTGFKGRIYFPALFTIFFFILSMNLLGLTPFGFTITGQMIVTFSLAVTFFIGWVIIGLVTLKFQFFKIFLPSGLPTWLIPLVVVIEILSFMIRPLSLSIRLFANMLAGHILLFIIGTASLVLAKSLLFLGLLPFSFILVFIILELGIAFLQAYVFTILLCIYLADSVSVKKH